MNNKLLSTSLSLACHTLFLFVAFNMVFAPSSVSAPISPPLLIHVHLDARPFSPSMGTQGKNVPKQNLVKPPEMKMPKMHDKRKPLLNAKEVFKNMKIAHQKIAASSLMPFLGISNQLQQIMQPSLESEIPNYQGETPYLPSDQNGSGTDIKSFLGYDLYTYEDPSDHVKYFKLSIKVEDIPGSLVPLPKEITFLIDASNSIGKPTLEQVKTGVEKSLEELGASDKFNLVVFKDQIHKMQEQAVINTPDNIHQGEKFLGDFQAGSSTDLYDTVLKSVDSPHTMKPSYIFLISDGEPTLGITDSLQLINKIGNINQGRVPIFGLGIGWSNEYFMNFLTFTNHGWAEFVPLDTISSITQLYEHIKDPVLINLRYNSIGLDKNEIYPKLLPDLFKGSDFVLYGRFTNEGKFLLQLRGDSQTDIKQYVIKDDLNNGHQTDRTIAEEWAMRKIYQLIGDLQYNQNNQALIDEVNQLALKFNLKIPQYEIKK